jgi:hypothetical protein
MPRLDRGIRYYRGGAYLHTALQFALGNAGSPGREPGDDDWPKSKGGLEARRFAEMFLIALGARAERGSTRA